MNILIVLNMQQNILCLACGGTEASHRKNIRQFITETFQPIAARLQEFEQKGWAVEEGDRWHLRHLDSCSPIF